MSDGRSYTYAWSDRGELLAETTQGVDVRTFTWDAAGRLVEATVFTLTTWFTYTGDGARVAVEVEGVGVTAYIPDRGRILEERAAATMTRYLYGRGCLGEVRDGTLLYYLADGRGYVRQSTDEDGAVVDAWLFSPDGGVMAGPQGPVSHLVCGGVYDWSTGLLYRGGRYFDPTLGIWLALGPLVVVQGWRERKRRKGGGRDNCILCITMLLMCTIVAIGLTSCGTGGRPPAALVPACVDTFESRRLGDNVFYASRNECCDWPGHPRTITWDLGAVELTDVALQQAIDQKWGGERGFGSRAAALAAFGVSAQSPIIMIHEPQPPTAPYTAASVSVPFTPFITVFPAFFYYSDAQGKAANLVHELGHYWDVGKGGCESDGCCQLSREMRNWINWGVEATDYGTTNGREDLAEAARLYFFWPSFVEPRPWTDDPEDENIVFQMKPWLAGSDELMIGAESPECKATEGGAWGCIDRRGTIRARDRWDWLQYKFGREW